ncbi:uncharacterized protein LOC100879667 isoform X2 [Megachile rotundata]|uniref:uncharacterized protein LOC100879667 isoform X2 n=1 Tax=Megachile rotundata TaxID=143995 RepID=UPI000258DA2B
MHVCHAHTKYDDRCESQQLRFQIVKLRMPQIMVEAFARSLIDKIMLEAFDSMDPSNEKLRMLDNRQESDGIESQSTRSTLQIYDRSRTEPESTELIEKMVRGLHNLQIGDSTFVSSTLSTLEKQVKHAVCSIGNTSPAISTITHVTQGQGDMHQIIHDAVIETTSDPSRNRQEKEPDVSIEESRVSINLLHRMIEELETKVEELVNEKEEPNSSKDKIAVWEESEEQFIRTIDNVDDADRNSSPSGNNFRSSTCELAYDLTSSPISHSVPFPKNLSLEDVAIEEIVSSPLPSSTSQSPKTARSESQKKSRKNSSSLSRNQKKKNILGRMRKLLRTIFGRRKK